MRTFVMGDIHGSYKALRQCLERSDFDRDKDRLIQLGDIVDRGDQVYECVEELLTIRNLIAIKGNHDDWFLDFIGTGYHPVLWEHGGDATARSYLRLIGKKDRIFRCGNGYKTALNPADIPETHQRLFRGQRLYHIDAGNNCYVHGGFNRHLLFKKQNPMNYLWDRDLWYAAIACVYPYNNPRDAQEFREGTGFNEIFIGHTPTANWNTNKPMNAVNVHNLDTGGGSDGKLTIMEVATKKRWQSDPIRELYRGAA